MSKRIICFGETLWDMLPSGAVPGGAPMNVAIRSKSFGLDASIISKVGNDKFGNGLIDFLKKKEVNTSLLQIDQEFPTGIVDVLIDSKGIATYDIKYPSAWDKIELTEAAIKKVKEAEAFIFGSLACRDHHSRQTLLELIKYAKFKVFDVNLRPGFFDLALIKQLMEDSDLVKLNDEEIATLAVQLGSKSNDLFENIAFLHNELHLNAICVTRGEKGAVLFNESKFYSNNGLMVNVADTVGSGDSFLAALIFKLLTNNNYQQALDFACAVGTIVATKTGANPEISASDIEAIMLKF
ncbi:MAG: carbohydrate kinase [Winogradskyella sp.]